MSDTLYNRSRPENFIGREKIQQEFWEFLNNVKISETDVRIICFSGRTGLGKSSLIVKLQEDCLIKPEYQEQFYIYATDITSVNEKTASQFLNKVIIKAFQETINEKFINLSNHKIYIESVEPPFLDSHSIQEALEFLKSNNKVLVIFFDQFETILSKPSLDNLFLLFEKVVYEVNSLKNDNLVLGFSWRTDMITSISHKAYHTWHNLSNLQRNIEISEFNQEEVENLMTCFSQENSLKKSKPNIQSLLKSCPKYPWLIRKLCSAIYSNNIDKSELIEHTYKKQITQDDIKKLFDKDLESLSVEEIKCLKYIAKNSPVDITILCEKYNSAIVNNLAEKKLIIKNGTNYKLYWDIFADYINYGKLPELTINYVPTQTIKTFMIKFRQMKNNKTRQEIKTILNISENSLKGFLADFATLFPCEYNKKSKEFIIHNDQILNLTDNEIAHHLSEQFKSHIVYQKIKKNSSKLITEAQITEILGEEYSISSKSIKDYRSRLLSWLFFTGLLEKRSNWLFAISDGNGKQKGKTEDCIFRFKTDKTSNQDLPLLKLLKNYPSS
ncbi:MAG: hypothetical protein QNJ42_12810 [Crocosphaera sp.]|nr:hypothetical protein [Crocosphaera sp.]